MEPYPHLMHADILPTAEEHEAILAVKQMHEKLRDKLHKEMRELKARLKEVKRELDATQQEIDTHARLVSPLGRIPPELLRDIYALATPVTASLPVTDMILHAPWTLLQVASQFASIGAKFVSSTGRCGHRWSLIPVPSLTAQTRLQV